MDEEKSKIHVRVIIEMMGAPKEHIVKTMDMLISKIKEDDEENGNIKMIGSETAEPVEKDNLWSLFSEMEVEVKDVPALMGFCFDYMPSSVEIIKPASFSFQSSDFTGMLNDMQERLHQIDMMLKGVNAENQLLRKNGSMLLNNIVILLLKGGEKDINALSEGAGIPADQLKKFLGVLVKDGRIKESKGIYSIAS